MANKIASAKNNTTILDAVYQREAVSSVLNSPAGSAAPARTPRRS